MIACLGLGFLIGGFCHYYKAVRHHPAPYEQRYATDDGGPEYVTMGPAEFREWVKGGFCPGGVRTKRYDDVKVVIHLCEMDPK